MRWTVVIPLINVALGVVLTFSVFAGQRSSLDTMLVGFYLAPLIAVFSGMALVDRHVRYAATCAGLLLVLVGLSIKHILGGHAQTIEIAFGLLVAALSLIPNYEFPPRHDQLAH